MSKLVLTMMVAGVLTMVTAPWAAAQQTRSKSVDETFAALDANQDGKLSMQEAAPLFTTAKTEQQKKQEFSKWDSDGNGSISKEEFEANYHPRGGK